MAPTPYSEWVVKEGAQLTLKHGRLHESVLKSVGIDTGYLDAFESALITLDGMPTNEVNNSELKHLTNRKDSILEECFLWCDLGKDRMENAFGKESREYVLFPTQDLATARRSERKMVVVMDVIIRELQRHHDVLQGSGQTQEYLDEGPRLLKQLKKQNSIQEGKKVENHSDTEERRQLLNQVYKTTNFINKCGRKQFRNEPAIKAVFKSPWKRLEARRRAAGETDTDVQTAES